jgi:hypothetical protein
MSLSFKAYGYLALSLVACCFPRIASGDTPARTIVIGEVHGNISSIEALKHYISGSPPTQRLAIGLELPTCSIQGNRIVHDLKCEPSAATDGRLSRELQDFISTLAGERTIDVFGFDKSELRSSSSAWEASAAGVIRSQAILGGTVIAITGNHHARLIPANGYATSIGHQLGKEAKIVFVRTLKEGTSRVCMIKGCGVYQMEDQARSELIGETCDASWKVYDCEYVVSRFQASSMPPVISTAPR